MAAVSSSSSSKGSLTPTQYGAYLKPSRVDLVKLHKEKLMVDPDDNIYMHLPSTITQDRDWNLPMDQSYLIHTVGHPTDSVTARRPIEGTNAYWKFQQSNLVADELGEEFGTETVLNLVFKGNGNKEIHGKWKATEYLLKNSDKKSAIVTLKCMDEKLVEKEQKVKKAKEKLAALAQERLAYVYIHDQETIEEIDEEITSLKKKLTKNKAELEKAKEEARTTELNNAAGVGVVHLVASNREAAIAAATATALNEIGRGYEPGRSSKKQK